MSTPAAKDFTSLVDVVLWTRNYFKGLSLKERLCIGLSAPNAWNEGRLWYIESQVRKLRRGSDLTVLLYQVVGNVFARILGRTGIDEPNVR